MNNYFVTFRAFFKGAQIKLKPDADKGFNRPDNALKSAKKDSENGQLVMVLPSNPVTDVLPHVSSVLAFNGQLYIPLSKMEQEALDE